MHNLTRRHFLKSLGTSLAVLSYPNLSMARSAKRRPNIVYILADDLGWGDISCYNPDGKVSTPHIDQLARQGIRFTDAHTTCAVCSPTRYSTLTGRYSWRGRLKRHVLPHFAKPLIEPDRKTIASLLKQKGYATAVVGKWHLGLGWQAKPGKTFDPNSWDHKQVDAIDFAQPLQGCPLDHGFDYYFGIGSSNNMLPYCLIENDRVVKVPTRRKSPEVYDTENGHGLVSDDYVSQNLDQTLWSKARTWLEKQCAAPDQPFFLYMPTSAIHRPCLPIDPFIQSSQAGLHGDKTQELDSIVGKVVALLKKHGKLQNTLIVFSSDNGAQPGDPVGALKRYAENDWGQKYHPQVLLDEQVNQAGDTSSPIEKRWRTYGHRVNGPYRGYKADIYEGGHRVPYILRWPGVIQAGTVSDQLICCTDFFATVAEILDIPLGEQAGEDSISFHSLLQGIADPAKLRRDIISEAGNATKALRRGPWKLILGQTGLTGKHKKLNRPDELYNLQNDPGETQNVIAQHPDIVKRLTKRYERYVAAGSSRDG
jgi:arylsulfatase A